MYEVELCGGSLNGLALGSFIANIGFPPHPKLDRIEHQNGASYRSKIRLGDISASALINGFFYEIRTSINGGMEISGI
jgi:hypothetical protein